MQYTRLGKSDLEISRVSFGCMSLKGNTAETDALLGKALDHGINFFDTADLYDNGDNEVRVGTFLKPRRNDVIIATKVGNQMRPDGSGWDWNPRKDYILGAVEKSLKRLRTDYIDLYQLHGGTIDDPIDETIEAFERLKDQGKIRYYGISSIRPNVIREYVKRSNIVSVMMQYSLLDRRPEETCFSLLQEHNIGVLSRGSIAQGLLIDKPAKEYLGWPKEKVAEAAKAIQSISEDASMSQTAIRFVLQHPPVATAVVGIRTLEQLQDLVAAADISPLSGAQIQLLSDVTASQVYTDHR